MILRRLAEGVRKQDWFTVVLEIMIVVVGIFLGLQVDDWNEARKDRVEEVRFLMEVKSEVSREIGIKEDRLETNRARITLLAEAIGVIQDDSPKAMLSPDQCLAAWRSHVINDVLDFYGLQSFADLERSGRLHIISNGRLRSSLLNYERLVENLVVQVQFISRGMAIVTDIHAEMFPRTLAKGRTFGDAECRTDLIRASQTVRNKLQGNLARMTGLSRRIQDQMKALKELKTNLEARP